MLYIIKKRHTLETTSTGKTTTCLSAKHILVLSNYYNCTYFKRPDPNIWGCVLNLYGSYLSCSNNGHRDTMVPLTEARTEMIHGQLNLVNFLLIHLARVSQSLSSSMENYPCLSYLHDKHEIFADEKTENTANTKTRKYPLTGGKEWIIHYPPGSNYLFCSIDTVPRCCRLIGSFSNS